MTEEHRQLSDAFAKGLAEMLGYALGRVLDSPEGEDKFIAYLERKAAERAAGP